MHRRELEISKDAVRIWNKVYDWRVVEERQETKGGEKLRVYQVMLVAVQMFSRGPGKESMPPSQSKPPVAETGMKGPGEQKQAPQLTGARSPPLPLLHTPSCSLQRSQETKGQVFLLKQKLFVLVWFFKLKGLLGSTSWTYGTNWAWPSQSTLHYSFLTVHLDALRFLILLANGAKRMKQNERKRIK